jgi:hypothetical protein
LNGAPLGGDAGADTDAGFGDTRQRRAPPLLREGARILKRVLLAATVAAATSPSLAGAIDASTPCSVAIQAFDSDKHAGQVLAGAPSQQVLEVDNYIMKVMADLDCQYTDASKPGVWPNFSDEGKHATAASAVANWRLHPDRTIYQAADSVYRSVRDIHIQLGIIK